jgi:hypothetical protein
MPRKKHPAVVVVAILQLVFGSIGLCLALYNLSGLPKRMAAASQQNLPPGQRQFSQEEIEKRLEQRFPNYHLMEKAQQGASAFMCLLMITSGIGLLLMQVWARFLTIGYAVLSILLTIANVIYAVAVVLPLMSELTRDLTSQAAPPGGGPPPQMVAQIVQGAMVLGVAMAALIVVYPITVLVIMLLPSVGAAFRGETGRGKRRRRRVEQESDEEPEPEDEDADDEDRPRRRRR